MMSLRTRHWLTGSGIGFLSLGLAVALVRAFIEADATGMNIWGLLLMTDTRGTYFIWSHDAGWASLAAGAVALGLALIITALPGKKAALAQQETS